MFFADFGFMPLLRSRCIELSERTERNHILTAFLFLSIMTLKKFYSQKKGRRFSDFSIPIFFRDLVVFSSVIVWRDALNEGKNDVTRFLCVWVCVTSIVSGVFNDAISRPCTHTYSSPLHPPFFVSSLPVSFASSALALWISLCFSSMRTHTFVWYVQYAHRDQRWK